MNDVITPAVAVRQHGAMEHSNPPCDLDAVRRYRLARIRQALAERDLAGIVLYDQINTTDLVGPYGYCCDVSRTWVCDARPNDEQMRIYAEAYAQIEHNRNLLQPGVTFRELTEKLRPLADEFVDGRYAVAMHGVGLCDEYPAIRYPQDWEAGGYDGMLEEGMVLCVEALAAPAGGREAVKLEEQVVITADGYEQLSSYPMEEDWL